MIKKFPLKELKKIYSFRDDFFKKYLDIVLLPSQEALSDALIKHVLDQDGGKMYAQWARQTGKSSTIISGTASFIAVFVKDLIDDYKDGKKFNIGLSVPKYEQVSQNFNDLKYVLKQIKDKTKLIDFDEMNGNAIRLSNGSTFYVFSLADGTSNQSKTLHMSIVDESQDINWDKYKKEINPMLASTNGCQLYLGVGCYTDSDFHKGVNNKSNEVFKCDCDLAVWERQNAFRKTKNDKYLNYKKHLETWDRTDKAFQTEFKLISDVSVGNFVIREQLISLRDDYFPISSSDEECYAGLDFAKSVDETVLTIISKDYKILNIYALKGDIMLQQDFLIGLIQQYPNLKKVFCDETGLGAGSTAHLRRIFGDERIEPITFTVNSKHMIYSNFSKKISLIRYSKLFDVLEKFEKQMCDLQKSFNSRGFMTCKHPDGGHDDYPDSLGLALLGFLDEYQNLTQKGYIIDFTL